MSVPTKPQTLATCAMFFAARGTRPGVETASHGEREVAHRVDRVTFDSLRAGDRSAGRDDEDEQQDSKSH